MSKLAYRNNPAYRQRCIAAVTARHDRLKNDPVYARLVAIRKKIVERRDSINRYALRIEALEKDLLALLAERDKLATERRVTR